MQSSLEPIFDPDISAAEMCKIIVVTAPTLADWLNRGFIQPSKHKAAARGQANIFSLGDAYDAALFKRLTALGLPRIIAKTVLLKRPFDLIDISTEAIDNFFDDKSAVEIAFPCVLISDGKVSVLRSDEIADEILEMLTTTDHAIVWNLEKIRKEIRIKVHEIKGIYSKKQ